MDLSPEDSPSISSRSRLLSSIELPASSSLGSCTDGGRSPLRVRLSCAIDERNVVEEGCSAAPWSSSS